MIRQRFAILDRDGTIIEEKNYLSNPDEVELLPGAAEGLRILREMDLGLVVLTNQSGLGRGYFDKEQLDAVHERMTGLVAEEGVRLDGIYYCPHIPGERCDCRKPKDGLLRRAAADLKFNPSKSFVIGDKPCDVELGRRVGATTILVGTGYGSEFIHDPSVAADYVMDDLLAAAQTVRARLTQIAIACRLRMAQWRARVAQLAAKAGDAAAPRAAADLPAYDLFFEADNALLPQAGPAQSRAR